MTSYAQAAAGVSPVPEKDHGLCCVSGCKLPGTLSTATLGSKDWYCRLHFGAQYADHGKITAMIANRYPLYRIALACANRAPGRPIPDDLVALLKRHGRVDLLNAKPAIDGGVLTMQTLGAHMLKVLDAECTESQKKIEPEPRETQTEVSETWGQIGEFV